MAAHTAGGKPVATWRDAQPVLRKAKENGKLSPSLPYTQFTKQVSNATRSLRRRLSGVTEAAAGALLRMQNAGEITLPELQGGRPRWSPHWRSTAPAAGGRAQAAVEGRMRSSLLERLAGGQKVSAATLRMAYKNQHWAAKGSPDELTEAINEALWQQQLAGNLWKPPLKEAPKVMVLFSGGQSGSAPAALLGLECVNYEIQEEYKLSETEVKTVAQSTDLTDAPWAGMIPWCAEREGLDEGEIRTVTVAQPCHTQTVLDHSTRGRGTPTTGQRRVGQGRTQGSTCPPQRAKRGKRLKRKTALERMCETLCALGCGSGQSEACRGGTGSRTVAGATCRGSPTCRSGGSHSPPTIVCTGCC